MYVEIYVYFPCSYNRRLLRRMIKRLGKGHGYRAFGETLKQQPEYWVLRNG
jgi:hypothetical protein